MKSVANNRFNYLINHFINHHYTAKFITSIIVDDEMDNKHAPSQKDLQLLEETLQNMDESLITIPTLNKKLKDRISKQQILHLLEYLEHSNKILITSKGITWIHNTNPKLKSEISKGSKINRESPSKKKNLKELDDKLKDCRLNEKDALDLGKRVNKKAAQKFKEEELTK